MKSLSSAVASALVLLAATLLRADRFSNLWYDGNAEISTYSISEMRYGEPREGVRIMAFVTEPMRLSTHIKPDAGLPDSDKIRVIKLNDLRKFTTGIYDYSVMTSTFAAVESKNGIPLGGTMKVAFTSQEWCGTVFEQTLRNNGAYENSIRSYFESEGSASFSVAHGDTVEAEEDLWILVRELQRPILEENRSKRIALLPSAWARRKAHVPLRIVDATLVKGESHPLRTAIGDLRARPFTWLVEGKKTVIWVEEKYPHRIISWEEPDGSRGDIAASRREPYWKRNRERDTYLRGLLKLPDGFGGT